MSSLISTEAGRKRLQTALQAATDAQGHPYYSGTIDGVLGPASSTAIIHFRTDHGLSPVAEYDVDLERELGLLTIQDPAIVNAAKAKGIDILDLLKLIGPVNSLLKGNPVNITPDQITGIIRALLAAVFGYITGKGWLDANTAATISGAVATILVAAWSIYSNRPKTIVPIAAK